MHEVLLTHAPVLGKRRFVWIVRCGGIFQADHGPGTRRVPQGKVVHGERAEVQAGEDRALDARMVQQAQQVRGNVIHVVGGGILRRLRLAHAAHIGRDYPVARRRQRTDLPVPAEPQVRETVAKYNRIALPLLHVVRFYAVDLRVDVIPFHCQLSFGSAPSSGAP